MLSGGGVSPTVGRALRADQVLTSPHISTNGTHHQQLPPRWPTATTTTQPFFSHPQVASLPGLPPALLTHPEATVVDGISTPGGGSGSESGVGQFPHTSNNDTRLADSWFPTGNDMMPLPLEFVNALTAAFPLPRPESTSSGTDADSSSDENGAASSYRYTFPPMFQSHAGSMPQVSPHQNTLSLYAPPTSSDHHHHPTGNNATPLSATGTSSVQADEQAQLQQAFDHVFVQMEIQYLIRFPPQEWLVPIDLNYDPTDPIVQLHHIEMRFGFTVAQFDEYRRAQHWHPSVPTKSNTGMDVDTAADPFAAGAADQALIAEQTMAILGAVSGAYHQLQQDSSNAAVGSRRAMDALQQNNRSNGDVDEDDQAMRKRQKRLRESIIMQDPETYRKSASASGGSGRKRIDIEFIPTKLKRQVTFSKRKQGLMKKLWELTTLTGTEAVLVLVAETGSVYSMATKQFEPLVQGDKAPVRQLVSSWSHNSSSTPKRTVPTGRPNVLSIPSSIQGTHLHFSPESWARTGKKVTMPAQPSSTVFGTSTSHSTIPATPSLGTGLTSNLMATPSIIPLPPMFDASLPFSSASTPSSSTCMPQTPTAQQLSDLVAWTQALECEGAFDAINAQMQQPYFPTMTSLPQQQQQHPHHQQTPSHDPSLRASESPSRSSSYFRNKRRGDDDDEFMPSDEDVGDEDGFGDGDDDEDDDGVDVSTRRPPSPKRRKIGFR